MRSYECIFIINPELEAEEISAVVEKYSSLVTTNGGEITKVDEWGRRRLAYEIQKRRDGYYVLMEYKGAADFVAELERVMLIDENIMKFLVTRKEEVKEAAAETETAAE